MSPEKRGPKKRKPVLTVGVRCLSVCESIYERTAARKKPSFPEWEKSFDFKALKRAFFLRKYIPFFRFRLIERETVTSKTSPTRLRRFGSNPVQKRQPLNLAGITLVFEPGRRVRRGSIVPGHHVARLPAPLHGEIRSCDVGQQVANDQNTLVLDPFKAPLVQPRRGQWVRLCGQRHMSNCSTRRGPARRSLDAQEQSALGSADLPLAPLR